MDLGLRGRVWTPIGPSPISKDLEFNGLVSAIAISPSNERIIYMGTGGGGMWKSMNGGYTWLPLFDREQSLGIGEPAGIAIDPNNSNILYLGTSNRLSKSTATERVVGPTGLFKSTDGGQSWICLGSNYPLGNTGNADQFIDQNINVVIIDPSDSNTLYLAADRGVFRSTDGGLNWIQGKRSFTEFLEGEALSLVLDASISNLKILYAGILGVGVFRSIDGGLNWTQVLGGTTPVVQAPFNKVVVDIAPPTSQPNPAGVQVIYTALRGIGGVPERIGIYLSRDQGSTWSKQSGADVPEPQFDYAFHMAVDPGSPGDGINDIIYLGGVGQRRSDDSGNKFENISSGQHADTHAWAFFRRPYPSPSVVYCGNDGGLVRSTDKGTTWEPLNSGGLQTGLFYNITTRPTANILGLEVGSLQDHGIYTRLTTFGTNWKGTLGGDGGDVAYDGSHTSLYASNWGGAAPGVWLSKDDGLTFPTEITPWDATSEPGKYIASIATDPFRFGTVYVSGSKNLWQSFDFGSTWRPISEITGSCDDIDVARENGNYVVMCVDDKVFISTNALAQTGVTFTNIKRNLPGRFVTRVRFDPNDPNTIYAVLAGFNPPSDPTRQGHVFRTSISATRWTDISPNVNVPCGALALDGDTTPTTIYVGAEFGVLRSVDGGSSWSVLDDIHFPRVPVLDLELNTGVLVAATYGRGAFAFGENFVDPVIAVNLENYLSFGTVLQGPAYLKLQIFNVGYSDTTTSTKKPLIIESVQRLMGSNSFSVLPTPGTPVVIKAGEHIDFSIKYDPAGAGVEEIATIRIISSDPFSPYVDLLATGRQEPYD